MSPELKDQPDWPLGPVDFSGDIPPPSGYRCLICNAHGVRLWRDWNCIAVYITLRCYDCVIDKAEDKKDVLGKKYTPESTQIDGLCAAIPTAEGDTFWGYSSAPAEGCVWWRSLSPRVGDWLLGIQKLRVQRDEWRKSYDAISDLREYELRLLDSWIKRTKELERRLQALGQKVEDWRP